MTNNTNCKNCNQPLAGKFCYNCGEKRVEEKDFYLKTLGQQFVDGVFNIDSKVYKTFISLLFKPGKLTISYIEGVRKPFMKPIQIFLVSNILFFLLLTQADILRIPAKYYFNSQRSLNIEAKTTSSHTSEVELQQNYDRVSSNISKSLVIIIVPLLAFVLWLLFYKSNLLYGMHLIFAMNYTSFFFICCLLAVSVSKLGNKPVQIFIIIFNFIYLYLSMRQVYKNTKMITIFKSLVLLILFIAITALYRETISYISFKLV